MRPTSTRSGLKQRKKEMVRRGLRIDGNPNNCSPVKAIVLKLEFKLYEVHQLTSKTSLSAQHGRVAVSPSSSSNVRH